MIVVSQQEAAETDRVSPPSAAAAAAPGDEAAPREAATAETRQLCLSVVAGHGSSESAMARAALILNLISESESEEFARTWGRGMPPQEVYSELRTLNA